MINSTCGLLSTKSYRLREPKQKVVERLDSDVPLHFTAFHPDFRMLDKPATPENTLRRAREIAVANGVRYCYAYFNCLPIR